MGGRCPYLTQFRDLFPGVTCATGISHSESTLFAVRVCGLGGDCGAASYLRQPSSMSSAAWRMSKSMEHDKALDGKLVV